MSKLQGKHFLITAGPTREPIDPVRFISNYSSGKMGIALAENAHSRGAAVTLILGPTDLRPESKTIKVVAVNSAQEMYEATTQYFSESDVIIFAAAVADYTPKYPALNKIKKSENEFVLELTKTKDIALELGRLKSSQQVCIGFALETESEMEHAKAKLLKKNLDFIVLNSLRDAGAGFQSDTNKISIIDKSGNVVKFDLKHKDDTAADILNYLEQTL
jgi:phosphopantothenoylcysteine decarboxylase/phosphopantothenate--cysteine ligase